MKKSTEEVYFLHLDNQDPLAGFRERFVIDDPDLIYLDGNSLGRLPKETIPHIQDLVENQWGKNLIRGWNEGWYEKPTNLGARLAELIGAQPDEVVVCDTTSVNLFKLSAAALRYQQGRNEVISDEFNFPTDLYIYQGVIDLLGNKHHLELIKSEDSISITDAAAAAAISDNTALVALTQVAFKSAFMYDIEKITAIAHQSGALTLWDLSHSIGAVPLELQEKLSSPIWGWFADQDPFAFNLDFSPTEGISRFQISTPHILSMAGIEPALDLLLEAGIDNIRQKSIRQTEYLIYLAKENLIPLGFQIGSPLDSARRGSHVSLRHPEAYRICQALINPELKDTSLRVIPDFRAPDNIRLGIAPLYTSFRDIHRAVDRLQDIIQKKVYQNYSSDHLKVT